jgi:hypothetical protein
VAQPGSAPDWGSGGRWFESSHPDQFLFIVQSLPVTAFDEFRAEIAP